MNHEDIIGAAEIIRRNKRRRAEKERRGEVIPEYTSNPGDIIGAAEIIRKNAAKRARGGYTTPTSPNGETPRARGLPHPAVPEPAVPPPAPLAVRHVPLVPPAPPHSTEPPRLPLVAGSPAPAPTMTPGEVDTMLRELAAREAEKDRLDASYRLNPKTRNMIGRGKLLFTDAGHVLTYKFLKSGNRERFEKAMQQFLSWPTTRLKSQREFLGNAAAIQLRKIRTLLRNEVARERLNQLPDAQKIAHGEWAISVVEHTIKQHRENMHRLGFGKKSGAPTPEDPKEKEAQAVVAAMLQKINEETLDWDAEIDKRRGGAAAPAPAAPSAATRAIPAASGTTLIKQTEADATVDEIIRQRGATTPDTDEVERTRLVRGGSTRITNPTERITQPDGAFEEVTEADLRAAREAAHAAVAQRNGRNPGLRDHLEKIGALHGSGQRLDKFEPEDPQPGDEGHSEVQDRRAMEAARDERLAAAIDEVKAAKPWKQEKREQLRESIAQKKRWVRNKVIPKRIRDDNDNGRFLGTKPEGVSAKVRGTWEDLKSIGREGREEARQKTGKTIGELQKQDIKDWATRKKEAVSRKLGRRKKAAGGEVVAAENEAASVPARDAEPAVPQQPVEERLRQPDAIERRPEEIVSDIERVERIADDVAQDVRRSKENGVPQATAESLRPKKGLLSRFLSGEWGRQRETPDYNEARKGDFGFMYEWSGKDDPKRIWAANNAINNQIGLTARRLSDSSIGRETLLHTARENLEKLLARNDGTNVEWQPAGKEKQPPVFYV